MRRAAGASTAVLLGCLGALLLLAPARADVEEMRLPGGPVSSIETTPVSLDVAVYPPDSSPAPAVILSHGFGGSRADLDDRARELSARGYLVLAYSARGFGGSSGEISMNSPAFEVADARSLIDYLSTRPDVQLDGDGDPRVGIAGASYGGALALLAAGYDSRIDAVVSDITWNDLESSLFGQSSTPPGEPDGATGVFKSLWTGAFFGAGVVNRDGTVTQCGRFTPQWCRAYTEAAAQGIVSEASRSLMRASSPGSVTGSITAPTLAMAGQADSLFPLAQANATVEQILTAHPATPVKVVWHGGGHDGGIDESARLDALAADWFDTHLAGTAALGTAFEVTESSGAISTRNSGAAPTVLQAPHYPGIHGSRQVDVPLSGPVQRVLAPAGGQPAAITSVPRLGGAVTSGLGATLLPPLPGQFATFDSSPLDQSLTAIGSSRVTLRISAADDSPADDAVLFASLRVVSAGGRESLPSGLVAPIRVEGLRLGPRDVAVDLPAVVVSAAAGDRLRVVVSTTDFAYLLPREPRLYDISLASAGVAVPLVATSPLSAGVAAYWWVLGALAIVGLLTLLMTRLRPQHRIVTLAPEHANDPLVITGLSKRYHDGYLAVDDVTFSVRAGSVLGLLGPNGAGKTTTMRMVVGLIVPTEGGITAFGEPVSPGAPVLSRIGSLVEGAGFLPHLTGRQNLELYWRAAGRAGDPEHLDEVLGIADLGSAIDRRVRTYSQGMRQRLGIAQAMLGKPDLLMLDEPTNGLDPPQIKAMREVLHRYAETGRTVIVSSHLLSEVQQTCTDVVVMHRGRLVGSGSVEELLRGSSGRLEDVFLEIVGDDLTVGLP